MHGNALSMYLINSVETKRTQTTIMSDVYTLERQLTDAVNRISQLERELREIRTNHWNAIVGHEIILKRLVDHTGCPPASGKRFVFPNVK